MTGQDYMAAAYGRDQARARRARELQEAIDRYLEEDDQAGSKLSAQIAAVRKDLVDLQEYIVRLWN